MWRRQDDKPSSLPETQAPVAKPATASAEPSPARAASARGATTLLSPGITVKGEIFGSEDLYLDGTVRGTVRLDGAQVTVGPRGRILADVEADQIIVQGQVEGNLRARQRVEISSAGVVHGDIFAARLHVQEGAVVCGHVTLEGAERPSAVSRLRPVAEPARSSGETPVGTPGESKGTIH